MCQREGNAETPIGVRVFVFFLYKNFAEKNGLTYFETDNERSMVEFGFWRGMISLETFRAFEEHCLHLPDELHPEKNNNTKESNDNFYPRNVSHKCNEIRNVIRNNLWGSDIYGIYRLCPKG